ncbi:MULTISPECIES: hypothetical protein [Spiroplasma]|uniref:hypothetical protein n=1 Tax=Spiroplasma TaxID=2132 RepID=UPI0018DC1B01|nr:MULTISPECIES: hypothetical protein [Spiroplasma]MBH8622944.1 hypothetical protein [Spiroplasma sp. hyd1]UNF62015.1 hypothetical protein MNU24_00685 [Spiroplasma poulsonii]
MELTVNYREYSHPYRLKTLLELWKKIDNEYFYSRNQRVNSLDSNIFTIDIGNQEFQAICQNLNIRLLISTLNEYKEFDEESFYKNIDALPTDIREYNVVNFNKLFPASGFIEEALDRKQAIKEIKEIYSKNPEYTFSANGYCPTDDIEDDLTGDGHYWTDWVDIDAEELIAKLDDPNYQIETWICNELYQDQVFSQEKIQENLRTIENEKQYVTKLESIGIEVQKENEVFKKVVIENKATIANLTEKLNRLSSQVINLNKENKNLIKTNNDLKTKLHNVEKSYQEFGELL